MKTLLATIICLFCINIVSAQDDISVNPTTISFTDYETKYIEFESLDDHPIESIELENSTSTAWFTITEAIAARFNPIYTPSPSFLKRISIQLNGTAPRNASATLNFRVSKFSNLSFTYTYRYVSIGISIRFGKNHIFDNIAEDIVADILALKPKEESLLLIS
jgi:Fe-S-cluster formation regulator IscX/YfhJ